MSWLGVAPGNFKKDDWWCFLQTMALGFGEEQRLVLMSVLPVLFLVKTLFSVFCSFLRKWKKI